MWKCYSQASCFLFVWLAGIGVWPVDRDISFVDTSIRHAGLSREQPSGTAIGKVRDSTMATWVSVSTTVGDGVIILNWKVIKEKNTVRYEIQRTSDTTIRYSVVGKVKALNGKVAPNTDNPVTTADKTSDSLNYTFTDFSVLPNTVYFYRLHQVCRNNLSCFSTMVSATASDPTQKINIYPNPANTFIYIANIGGRGILRIYDQSGRSVLEAPLEGDQQQVNVSTLSTGSYYARIDREGKVQYQQVLIINSNY
jgi:Secretion system C-terminal sorting domain